MKKMKYIRLKNLQKSQNSETDIRFNIRISILR